jgi:tyrosyl-tRNA synthetase
LMWRYFELLSFESSEAIRKLKDQVAGGGNPRDVKVLLGREIVSRFHGAAAARSAEEEFEQRFRHGVLPEDMPEVAVTATETTTFAQLLKMAGLVESTSEANRVIEQGGVRIDGERLTERSAKVARDKSYVVQVGKRKFARVKVD